METAASWASERKTHILECKRRHKSGSAFLDDLVAVDPVDATCEHRRGKNIDEALWIEAPLSKHGNCFAEHLKRGRRHDIKQALDYTGMAQGEIELDWRRALHLDDRKDVFVKWAASRESGKRGSLEARLIRFDGGYRWCLFEAEPLRFAGHRIGCACTNCLGF